MHTAPRSWSAHADAESLAAWALAVHDDLFGAVTDLLVDVSPSDVPRVLARADGDAVEPRPGGRGEESDTGGRDASVLACIDGESSLDALADLVGLPTRELLAALGRLCARGLVALDRSRRHGA